MQNGNSLYHYGVLGMRWGRHRYINSYGGLNNAGRERVKKLESEHDELSNITKLSKKGVQRKVDIEKEYEHLMGKPISERLKIPAQKPKSMHDMTNQELTEYNTRKQLEATYQSFQPKPQISKGKQFASTVGKKFILPIAVDVGKAYITSIATDKVTGKDMSNATSKAFDEAAKAAEKTSGKVMKSLIK